MQSTVDAIRLAAGLPERVRTRIQLLLASVPDPVASARCLERLRHDSPSGFERICSSAAALRHALTLFSYSSFLTEDALHHPERILELGNSGNFYRVLPAEEFRRALGEKQPLAAGDLSRFRRRQLLRIVLRDVLGAATL